MRQMQFDCAVEGGIDLSPTASCFPQQPRRKSAERILFPLPTRPELGSDRTSEGTVKLFPNVHIHRGVIFGQWSDFRCHSLVVAWFHASRNLRKQRRNSSVNNCGTSSWAK